MHLKNAHKTVFYTKMHRKAISLYVLQRAIESPTYQHNEELFAVVENFELHLCYDLAPADSKAGYQTAMSPNERKVPQRGRTDEAHRSRGIKGPTTTRLLVQKVCTCASCSTSTYLDAPQER